MNITEIVAESNRIEGITRPPTQAEIAEHVRLIHLPVVTIPELVRFVGIYQPNAVLRDRPGLDVRIGSHIPPAGHPNMKTWLADILAAADSPWRQHLRYEALHPFTDGNGRSGRALWHWRMRDHPHAQLGFLHAFYYATLQNSPADSRR